MVGIFVFLVGFFAGGVEPSKPKKLRHSDTCLVLLPHEDINGAPAPDDNSCHAPSMDCTGIHDPDTHKSVLCCCAQCGVDDVLQPDGGLALVARVCCP